MNGVKVRPIYLLAIFLLLSQLEVIIMYISGDAISKNAYLHAHACLFLKIKQNEIVTDTIQYNNKIAYSAEQL